MTARCAKCQQVFEAGCYGRQFCPHCGSELMFAPPARSPHSRPPPDSSGEPSAPPADLEAGTLSDQVAELPSYCGAEPPVGAEASGGSAPPSPRAAQPPVTGGGFTPPPPGPPAGDGLQDQSTPWEQRSQLGFLPALFETVKRSATDPVNFFGRMRVDNVDGAASYYWLVAGVGGVSVQLRQAAISALHLGGAWLPRAIGLGHLSHGGPLFHVGLGVAVLLLAPVFLYMGAAILHLFAMVLRSGGNGFNATLRAVAYASGPNLLAAIPWGGAFVGGIWTLSLLVIAVWKLQRTSVGLAVGVVLVPMALLLCFLAVAAMWIVVASTAPGDCSNCGGP